VAVDLNGNATAAWVQTRYPAPDEVWSNRYIPGTGWGTAERIDIGDTGDAGPPQVAVDLNGNATAVWAQYDGTRPNIWSNRYTPSGGWGTAVLIETDTDDANAPQVAVDPNGNVTAVWWARDRQDIWSNRFE
jgi:hypothetical protein